MKKILKSPVVYFVTPLVLTSFPSAFFVLAVLADAFVSYFADAEGNLVQIRKLMDELTIEKQEASGDESLKGMSFVITGSLNHFANRDALKEIIEQKGGKVTGSVTGKTTLLINNDITSSSSKNKKAKELGVEIVTEDTFMERYLKGN